MAEWMAVFIHRQVNKEIWMGCLKQRDIGEKKVKDRRSKVGSKMLSDQKRTPNPFLNGRDRRTIDNGF